MIKNNFYKQVAQAEMKGASIDDLRNLLGKGRSKRGIFEGDLEEGELEIGQAASFVKEIKSAAEIIEEIWQEYNQAKALLLK